MHHVRIAFISLILLLWVAPARAGTVAIVQRTNPTPALFEALSRIHGELLAVGLDVTQLQRPREHESNEAASRAWLERIAAEGQIDAIIDIVGDLTPIGADVWVIERAPRRLTGSRITLEPNTRNAPETLAIRSVEVLRSTFLERDMAARDRPESPTAAETQSRQKANANRDSAGPAAPFPRSERPDSAEKTAGIGMEVGAVVVTSLEGIGPALAPMARFDWRVHRTLELQTTFAGFGTNPTVTRHDGSARISQHYGTVGGCFGLRAEGRLRPLLALSAGVLRTAVEGHAPSPRQGHEVTRWALLFDASIGAELSLTEHVFLRLAAHAQIAEPYVAIHITDTVVATSGRPNFALALTVGSWL